MSRYDRLTVYNTMLADGMVPLFYHADITVATNVSLALARGGARLLEFTNRGDFAIEVFSALVTRLAQEQSQMIIGVGTVDDPATAALYIQYGANFVVAPTFNPDVARMCNRRKVAYLPGVATVSEIALAEEFGAEIVKLFPAETAGGPTFVKAVLAPRPWTRIMPSGGVTTDEANLRTWFEAGVACVGMGSQLVKSAWVAAGDYTAIEHETTAVLQRIRSIRGR
ncbi:MAG: bifunctional 4-hydroxy-2-oxoglutarate aldolase/2-dehydro-3-deoxy-phosphogluconate aldolase [Chloroflexota bacterium]|nr:bifunctional 4-hydroxy-2-oxoglutarate aldolase/2-dehydro-3-deoxy-phosphogluconate aldolase [Chloroflexota bacterium]